MSKTRLSDYCQKKHTLSRACFRIRSSTKSDSKFLYISTTCYSRSGSIPTIVDGFFLCDRSIKGSNLHMLTTDITNGRLHERRVKQVDLSASGK